jgi:hypothetical protein
MTKNKEAYNDLFIASGCLSQLAIERYIDGTLDDSAKELITKHTHECPLCSDALEGAEDFNSGRQFSQLLDKMHNSDWRISINKGQSIQKRFYFITSAAASILLLVGLFYLFWTKSDSGTIKNNASSPEIAYSVQPLPPPIQPKYDKGFQNIEDESSASHRKEDNIMPLTRIQIQTLKKEEPEEGLIDESKVVSGSPAYSDDKEINFLQSPVPAKSSKDEEFELKEEPQLALEKVKSANYPPASEPSLNSAAKTMDSPEYKKERSLSFNKSDKKVEVFGDIAENIEDAQFKGEGIDTFIKYLKKGLKDIVTDSLQKKKLIIGFTVNDIGKLENIKLIKGTGQIDTDTRIIEFVKKSPDWTPKKLSGIAVRTDQTIEVSIR